MPENDDLKEIARGLVMSEPLMVLGTLAAKGGQHIQDAYDTLKQHLSTLGGQVEQKAKDVTTAVSGAASKVADAIVPKLKAEGVDPLVPGNIDLFKQPEVKNPDGTTSTVDSRSYNFGGREYLLPSVTPDGRHLRSDGEIISEFRKTGRHLGIFDTPENATTYAKQLHEDYAAGKYKQAGADQYIKLPDGSYAQFPASMSDDDIQRALQKSGFGAQQLPETAPAFNPPRFMDTPQGALLGATPTQAKDTGIGMAKGAARTAIGAGELVAPVLRQVPGVNKFVATPEQFGQAREAMASSNTAQMVGGGIETAAELALPVGKGIKAAAEIIPTTAKAGEKFQSVMAATKDLPVSVAAPGAVALRLRELADAGGSMPKVAKNFLSRITDPDKGPLNYAEARDFASNVSRLSANEYQRLTPVVAREVANLRVTLNKAIAETAAKAGKGQEYAQAMNEYARAMQIRGVFDSVVAGMKRGAPYAGAAGLGTYLTKKLASLIGSEP